MHKTYLINRVQYTFDLQWSSNSYVNRTMPEKPEWPPSACFWDIYPFWRPGEWIWHGTVSKDKCVFDKPQEIHRDIRNYFESKSYEFEPPEDYNWNTTQHVTHQNFLKQIWLTNEFVNNDLEFDNPLCGHWDPRSGNIKIHPGGARNKIVLMFGNNNIRMNFFNTGSIYTEWMSDFTPWDLDEMASKGWEGSCVPDHGTFIPHLCKDLNTIDDGNKKWHTITANKLNNDLLKIHSKFKFPYLERWQTDDVTEANVKVIIKTSDISELALVTAIYAIFAEINYENEEVKIKHVR